MITLFSDDSYFSLGTEAGLSSLGYNVRVIDPMTTGINESDITFSENDIALVSVSDTKAAENVLQKVLKCRISCIYFIDAAVGRYNHLMWAYGIIPKNIALHHLPRMIKTLHVSEASWLRGLTLREMQVMNGLLDGKNNYVISCEMKISEKTVSAHKNNALQKLGLTKLNSRAIEIYGQYRMVLRHRLFGSQ
ncbi:helix-turn-helix domain-containing protein [Dryocola clanedunensis]